MVADRVKAEITERHTFFSSSDFRNKGGGVQTLAEQGVETALVKRRLPEILSIGILELADGLHCGIVQKPYGIFTVGTVQRIEQVDKLIRGDRCAGCGSHAEFSAACGVEDAGGLAGSIGLLPGLCTL